MTSTSFWNVSRMSLECSLTLEFLFSTVLGMLVDSITTTRTCYQAVGIKPHFSNNLFGLYSTTFRDDPPIVMRDFVLVTLYTNAIEVLYVDMIVQFLVPFRA